MSRFNVDLVAAALAPTLAAVFNGTEHSPLGRHAGVAAVLRPGPEGVEILLIRRAEAPSDPWSGHMALPGGHMEPGDRDALDAARRETREEVGLDLGDSARLLGRLSDVPATARGRVTDLTVVPFVFLLTTPSELLVNDREVAEALWVDLHSLTGEAAQDRIRYERDGHSLDLPAWNVSGRIVWGLTYQMLRNLLETLARFEEQGRSEDVARFGS